MIIESVGQQADGGHIHPQDLPADGCKYKQWHHLRNNETAAHQLKCPRIRRGPEDESSSSSGESSSSSDDDVESGKNIKRHNYMSPYEDWAQVEFANLSYQDLGHDYQEKKFYAVLSSLSTCRQLNITQNCLVNLRSVRLKKCKSLNATKNRITSFKKLPVCPNLLHLNLTENNITSLAGCESYKKLKSLVLLRNPIQYTTGYRGNTFRAFPNLQVLDGVPISEDDLQTADDNTSSTCTVS